MVSRGLVPMRERMRRAARGRQAATACGGWRAGHNGGDAATGIKRETSVLGLKQTCAGYPGISPFDPGCVFLHGQDPQQTSLNGFRVPGIALLFSAPLIWINFSPLNSAAV